MVAEESSAIGGDGGQAAISFMSDINGTHIHTFENSKLEGSSIGDLLCFTSNTSLSFSLLLQD